VIASDDSCRIIPDPGPVKYSDIYSGEMFDASIDDTRWRLPDSPFAVYAKKDEGNFPTAVDNHSVPCVAENVSPEIIWRRNAGVRHQGSLSPVSIVHTDAGTWLIDFGKDIAGRERMILRNTRAGAVVTVRHGEWLNPDGTLYTANYRSADAMTTYICGGNAEEVYEPRYTWYGFRYMEISGWPGELSPNQITAEILGEPLADAGFFRCSDELVNKWAESVRQTLKNDVFEVPMDCHQRDERLGWTGDAQIFMNTSTYFCQGAAFYTKWTYDVFYGADSQKHGCFPIIAPYFSDDLPFSSVWSDAGIYAPLTMYMKYGDVRLLKEGYVRMSRWLDYQCECQVKPWIVNSSRYKDWLCLGPDTSSELVATACWYGIHLAMIPLARLLERPEDADRWTERAKHIKQAFIQEFYDDDGCIRESSQTAALLALRYGLTDERTERKTLDALLQNIRITNGGHIATGITGTPLMMKTLTQFGQSETAYDLLLQKTAPGWLNEIILGATAVWEHWDSYVPEKGFMDPSMNSFSHCGLGSAGEWLFEGICGIQPLEPGFRSFLLRPNMTDKLDYAEAEFESEYGLIRSAWKHTEDGFEWKIAVPKNTCAKISIPSMEQTLNPGNYTVLIRSSGQTAFVN